jgi:hypothetical protein
MGYPIYVDMEGTPPDWPGLRERYLLTLQMAWAQVAAEYGEDRERHPFVVPGCS